MKRIKAQDKLEYYQVIGGGCGWWFEGDSGLTLGRWSVI